MTFDSPSHPLDKNDLEAARSQLLRRAGLRSEPRGDQPTGAFVAIEMAVLVLVSALAMVSVIVTTCSPAEARAVMLESHGDVAKRPRPDATVKRPTLPAMRNADRSDAASDAAK